MDEMIETPAAAPEIPVENAPPAEERAPKATRSRARRTSAPKVAVRRAKSGPLDANLQAIVDEHVGPLTEAFARFVRDQTRLLIAEHMKRR